MRLKLIACEVLTREIGLCVARTPHIVDVEYIAKGAHEPDDLRVRIQAAIDRAEAGGPDYDAIVIGFGLCGNAMLGVTTRRYRMVVPRAHDCCTLYLGSKQAFAEHFGENPSQGFTALGYLERPSNDDLDGTDDSVKFRQQTCFGQSYADMVAQYGEDNAAFIWSTLHPEHTAARDNPVAIFIDQPEIGDFGQLAAWRERMAAKGKELLVLNGSLDLVRQMVSGEWPDEAFVIVEPGQKLAGVYDLDQVVRVDPA